jgi:hypothetical protein
MNEDARMDKDKQDPSWNGKQLAGPVTQPLSEREIRKQLLLDSLQDKRSLLPIALSLIALIYSLLYAPVLGGLLIGLGVAIAAGVVGSSVFIWRYVICYQQNYTLKSRELVVARFEAQNRYLADHPLVETHALLETGLSELKAVEGLNILHALDHEYRSLGPVLNDSKETDLLSISNLEVMLNETYFRGLSVLEDVFELERAIHATDETRLHSEIAELQRKAAESRADPVQQSRAGDIDERIASNQDRIHIVSQLRQRVEELLYQARRCEAALGKTRIELVAIKTDASESGVDAVIEALRKTIDRASEVQEELKQMGY